MTTRRKPRPASDCGVQAQVTEPSDGLCRSHRRPPKAAAGATATVADDRLNACTSRHRRPEHRPAVHPLSPGHGLEPTNQLAAASAVGANVACRGGQQQDLGTGREWCPVSLVVLVALRRSGRAETLTRPTSHQRQRTRPPQRATDQPDNGERQQQPDARPERPVEATLPPQPRRQLRHAVRSRACARSRRQADRGRGLTAPHRHEPEAQAPVRRRRHPPDARFPASATGRPRSRELTAEQKAIDRAARLTISAALGHEKGQVTAVYSRG